jgi:hypothetical protein
VNAVNLVDAGQQWWVSRYHLLLDSAPNLGPLISRWEINKFESCWCSKSVRILEVLKLFFQQFSNLSSFQQDMNGPILGALSNNRWLGIDRTCYSLKKMLLNHGLTVKLLKRLAISFYCFINCFLWLEDLKKEHIEIFSNEKISLSEGPLKIWDFVASGAQDITLFLEVGVGKHATIEFCVCSLWVIELCWF